MVGPTATNALVFAHSSVAIDARVSMNFSLTVEGTRTSPESPLVAQRPDKQIQPAPDYSFRASAIPGCADGDRLKYWSYRE